MQAHASQSRRFKLATAAQYADTLRAFLQATPGIQQVVVAGSFRRMRDTVGDLDILVTATPDSAVMQRFSAYDEVVEVFSAGAARLAGKSRRAEHPFAVRAAQAAEAHDVTLQMCANDYNIFSGWPKNFWTGTPRGHIAGDL